VEVCFPLFLTSALGGGEGCEGVDDSGVFMVLNHPRSAFIYSNSSLREKLRAVLLHVQIDQTLFFYVTTDVLPDDGPTRSDTCRNIVCF
jgi:hypothetical protein